MKATTSIIASGLFALASAQVASVSPANDITFRINIPQDTASSGNGDIFFSLSAPTDYEWVALGQGSRMSGSNIFVVYTSSDGNNVTLSPRLASDYNQPSFSKAAQVTLLEGSGVSNGRMTANVKCSNCQSWDGGSADFKADSGNWVYAAHTSGGPKNDDSQSASISKHDERDAFSWSYASAKGGDSVNPLLNSAVPSGTAGGGGSATSCVPRPTGAAASNGASSSGGATATKTDDNDGPRHGPPTGWPYGPGASPTASPWDHNKRQNVNYCDDSANAGFTPLGSMGPSGNQRTMLIAHGTLAALAFVIFFPMGAIAIRLASFPGVVWLHAAFQVFAYLVYIAAFGLGVYIANGLNMLDRYHPIIGIVVFVCLFFQPIFGFLHHSLFKKYQTRTFWSYAHLWLGRLVITLGIINGGLGFMLADTMGMGSRSGMIAYSVIAGIIWLVWVAASVFGESRRKKARVDAPPKYTDSPRSETREREIPHPDEGHYAPQR
ncbi:CBD9-like protein [Polyplosphaeria fusca]|uniref:CBD9-like protein n=1 Tax=Polyplosphaeria fusca TaxID=682080 RepID=A0A9P4QN24_9PLEO|nr:CBD9-like protein [Polyplosphaeria fusca]